MISRRTIVNLITFLALSGLLTAYGFLSLVQNPLAHERSLSTVFPDTGGLKAGFSVTMRGVPIGSVRGLKLVPGGVRVTAVLQSGTTVPADVTARVERANPLGEQQLELVPTGTGNQPPLRDGATIPNAPDPVPPAVGDVVDAANRLFDSIPTGALATLIHQSAVALSGRSSDLRTIIESIDTASRNFLAYQQGFKSLLANAPPVLNTVAAVGPQLRQALANTIVITDLLAQRRNDLVQLFNNSAALGSLGTQLLDAEGPNLSCLIHDVGDLSVNLSTQPNYGNFDTALLINQSFFGPIDAITPKGRAVSLGPGSVTRNDQTWLRVRTILPPAQPAAVAYPQHTALPPTLPGGACLSVLGAGVGAASQTHPQAPGPGGVVIPAPAPTVPDGSATAAAAAQAQLASLASSTDLSPAVAAARPSTAPTAPKTTSTTSANDPVALAAAAAASAVRSDPHPEVMVFLVTALLALSLAYHRRRRVPSVERARRPHRGGVLAAGPVVALARFGTRLRGFGRR